MINFVMCFTASIAGYTQDLYEFVFVRSGMNTAFTISTTFPRSIIPVSSLTTIAELQVDSVLAVTVEENSPHPLSYLSEEDYNLPKVSLSHQNSVL